MNYGQCLSPDYCHNTTAIRQTLYLFTIQLRTHFLQTNVSLTIDTHVHCRILCSSFITGTSHHFQVVEFSCASTLHMATVKSDLSWIQFFLVIHLCPSDKHIVAIRRGKGYEWKTLAHSMVSSIFQTFSSAGGFHFKVYYTLPMAELNLNWTCISWAGRTLNGGLQYLLTYISTTKILTGHGSGSVAKYYRQTTISRSFWVFSLRHLVGWPLFAPKERKLSPHQLKEHHRS